LIATIFLVLKGGDVVGPHLALLGQFFIGYQVTFGGSIVGFLYGLLSGFVIGYVIATLYNWMASIREKRARRKSIL
jgi:fructose-specific phosphotransferase system IIC component